MPSRDNITWLSYSLALVSSLFLLIYFLNNILTSINYHTGRWEAPYLFPLMEPVGADFRAGYYDPARYLMEGKSPYLENGLIYPPFSALFAVPFTLFPVETAYALQVALLFFLNMATIYLAIQCLRLALSQMGLVPGLEARSAGTLLFVLVSFYTLTGYGFIFSAERGNFDIYPQFFSILALWMLIKKPSQIWLPVILISLAAHLKIYPAALFVLILWVHGRKSLLPLLVANLFLLLIIGPFNAVEFLKTFTAYTFQPYLWEGNHSAASFTAYLNQYTLEYLGISLPEWLFYVAPVLIWAGGVLILRKWGKKSRPLSLVLLFVLSVPLMNLLPSVSHDYKLVLLSAPLAILLIISLWKISESNHNSARIAEIVKIVLLMLLMLGISRTYVYSHPAFKNKYLLILLIQFLSVIEIISMSYFPQLARFLQPHPADLSQHFGEVDKEKRPAQQAGPG
jgi:hypothetical protein